MPLIYSLVARGTTVLADYTAYTGNFSTVAIQCLEKCPTSSSNLTLTCDGHTFNYTIDGSYIFLAVADEEYGRIPFVFLERVQAEWRDTLATRGLFASAHSLDKTFGPRLKFHMEYCESLVEELARVVAVQNKVGAVKNIMVDSIENVLARGEKIELRVDNDDLRFQADTFNKTGKELCSRMWRQNMQRRILIVTVTFALIFMIFLLLCFAPADPCIK